MDRSSLPIAEDNALNRTSSGIFRIENHDEALRVWRDSGRRERILVHVDAHHDLWWVPDGKAVTIANFISPALRDGLFREIHWVVPDRSWESAGNRRQILHHLYRLQEDFPGRPECHQIRRDGISTTLLGKPLHVSSVEGLPKFREAVLLDLDVDYLILPRVTYGYGDPHPPLPWIWPGELLSRLHARGVQSDLTTIAYSVQGGYTPLGWKYLGDELEARLSGADRGIVHGMELHREAAEAAMRREFGVAEHKYLEAEKHLPNLAAPSWHLAHLYLDCGRTEEGQQRYKRALDLDSSYRTPFNSSALWHYWHRRWEALELECRRVLALDPCDAFARLEQGWFAMERSQWKAAESKLLRALEVKPDLLDGHRALGKVYQKLGRRPEAISAYEESLKLALNGQEALHECPGIGTERFPLNDMRHFDVFLHLGKLYLNLGERGRATNLLRMAAAGGLDGVGLRLQIASHEFRGKQWKVGMTELAKACKQLALQTVQRLSWLWHSAVSPFQRAYELWQVR